LDVVSATTIAGRTGARGSGVVDVAVVNPDGQTAVLAGAYTYAGPSGQKETPR
jgi:hypothetical protein